MKHFDVFNGDADGICALHQLRLASPVDSVLVTGMKRDIALLDRVDAAAGDRVTVLDVSAHVNRTALFALLDRGARVQYFDHHFAGHLPAHPRLHASIDTSAETCTSLLVDEYLHGLHPLWAIVGAYGDDLAQPAEAYADRLALGETQRRRLRELGEAIAYNAYGDCEADLIIHPRELYRALAPYVDPLMFMDDAPICRRLSEQKSADLGLAALAEPELALAGATIYILPDDPWARRVRGLMANELAKRYADLAHAVLTHNRDGGYTVSVRAPRVSPSGADAVCRKFHAGGGRLGAAGINHLPQDALPRFAREMDRAFPEPGMAVPPQARDI